MKRNLPTLSAILLLSTIFLSTLQISGINFAKASNAEEIYVPYYQETSAEIQRAATILPIISNYFRDYGNYQYRQYWQLNFVTRSLMGSQQNGLGYYYDFVAILTKGHDVPWGCGMHYKLLDYYGVGIEDNYMYSNTIYGKHDFVFLWHCGTARSYWGTQYSYWCPTCYAYMGHCYCWQHNNQMSTDGYGSPSTSYPEVFLGFNWTSADFSRHDTYMKSGYDYGSFANIFYQKLLQSDKNVHQALDLAAQAVFINCYSFGGSPLRTGILGAEGQYSALKVYGNGNRGLP